MNTFLSAVKKIFHVAEVGAAVVTPFAPQLEAIPGFGSIFGIVYEGILVAEQLVTTPSSGPAKKAVATSITNAMAPGLDPAAISNAIDLIVQALNHLKVAAPAPAAA